MLSAADLDAYLAPIAETQAAGIRWVRSLIVVLAPDLVEQVDTGKWFGGLLTYKTEDGIDVFALGPLSNGFVTFHMMPFYGSPKLQENHGPALKKFLSGKSCIKFAGFEQLPEASLREIIAATPTYAELARALFAKRNKKK